MAARTPHPITPTMNSLQTWAARWGISSQAMHELTLALAPQDFDASAPNKSEAQVLSNVRLEAAQKGIYLFRNNVGAGAIVDPAKLCGQCYRYAQRTIRWGLANDSKRLNDEIKSADLIGIRKRVITSADVGSHIGQFISREIKAGDWRYSGTKRELAQVRWAALIESQGGDAQVVNKPGSL